ncbi:MAG TPA: DUF6603 domain-containing protein [Chitinophagaceae bacterium]|nr:DUF6603 domain-containing protein [Chitinophagaceae bacterium]
MAQQDALKSLLIQAGLAISPLRSIKTPEAGVAFFRKLGYDLPTAAFGSTLPELATQSGELLDAVKKLVAASDDAAVIGAVANIFGRLVAVVKSITTLHGQIQITSGGLPGISDLPRRLTDFLVLDFLDKLKPQTHEALHLLGLIEHEQNPAPTNPMRLVNWDRIGQLFNKPSQIVNDVYKWDTGLDTDELLARLEALMRSSTLPGGLYPQADTTRALLGNASHDLKELRFALFQKGVSPETYAQFGLTFSPVEAQGSKKKGIALLPYLMGTAGFTFEVCDRGQLDFSATGDIKAIGVVVRPPLTTEGLLNLTSSFKATVQIHEKPEQSKEIILIGSAGASRLSLQGLGFSTFIQSIADKIDVGFEGEIKAIRLVINGGDGDGFLQKILSGLNVEAESSMAFGFSLLNGFYLRGGAKFALDFAVHIDLGPLNISGMQLALAPANDHFNLQAGATISLSLGPLKAVVENIGIQAALAFRQGNLGPLDLSVGFKPPNGVGLMIDAAVVKGGGYLYFDFDKEEYAGVLELSIAGLVTVKAIGLITTRMPDGSKGFSLLVIITAEFATGIQLGFGFTLLGVGGLLGLNRTMLLEPIGAGIRTGAINSIMFPPDPVANAPRIISDLRTYFPPYEGKFLIGPMIKIGWGTPTLISLAFGIIIEIPGNIAIVGVLKIALPEEDAPLIVINVAFIGALEFDKSRVWFFAAMFDSRILFMTMEGEMGLLMDFSDHPNFVLSVGGFHPQFNPPPLPFPSPKRIHIDVLRTAVARITVENYFAITSNTVQFGARAEMFYGIDAFNIHGNFSFDALFQFSPFHFIIDISFSVGMDVFGAGVFSINLKLTLSGPAPWEAKGTGTLSIDLWLFSIDISVDFDISWGDATNPTLPPVAATPLLKAELDKADNWRAAVPSGVNLLVTLRKLDTDAQKLVLHPVGTLKISQRVIPLGVHIDKVGANAVSDAHLFTLTANVANLGTTPASPTEKFAIAQFQNMDDAQKLSIPSFQDLDSGIELAFSGKQLGSVKIVKRVVRYEVKMIDGDDKYHVFRWFKNIGTLFFHWLAGSAITRSSLSYAAKQMMVPTRADERIRMRQPGYVVASILDNKPLASTTVFASEAHARDYYHTTISKNPAMAEDIHVIPTFEANV